MEFGTSGLLYRSNKLMYDRRTLTLWRQFTGEPVVGDLAYSGIKLKRIPVVVTTWSEWFDMHPDTTVLSQETGVYPADAYLPESNSFSIYYNYRVNPGTMFPVWLQDDSLRTKATVLGVILGGTPKAYPLTNLNEEPLVVDTIEGVNLVVVTNPEGGGPRAYLSSDVQFQVRVDVGPGGLSITDTEGKVWRVTEEALVRADDPSRRLERIPTHMAYWFGWHASYPNTQLYGQEAE